MKPPSQDTRKRIGELMIDAGLITSRQLADALEFQKREGGKIVEGLIALGYIDAEQFVDFLARQPGIPSIDLSYYEVPRELIDLVPREYAVKHEVFPVDRLGKLLTLGMVCPLDKETISQLEQLTGLRVKPLLCSPNDVRGAIQRYYPRDKKDLAEHRPDLGASLHAVRQMAAPLKLTSVVKLIRNLKSLPALSETVERVRAATVNPDISVAEVAAIVKRDPPILAKVLSVANSAAYGFPHRVDRVEMAVSLLGLRETYAIVLSAAVINLFDESKAFDYARFWEQSLRCAAAMRVVGKTNDPVKRSALVPIGLLLDIGCIAMAETVPDRYAKVPQNLTGLDLVRAEEEVCGIAHPEAGYELATHWGLPQEICQPIRFHHAPDQADAAGRQQAALACIAQSIASTSLKDEEECNPCAECEAALGLAKLTEGQVREFLDQFNRDYPLEA